MNALFEKYFALINEGKEKVLFSYILLLCFAWMPSVAVVEQHEFRFFDSNFYRRRFSPVCKLKFVIVGLF